jgi:hypothetical protein
MNPSFYIFDRRLLDSRGVLRVRNPLPYSDLAHLPQAELEKLQAEHWPLEFGHSLQDQIGGQLEAGLVITGFYEDVDTRNVLHKYLPIHLATRAIRM